MERNISTIMTDQEIISTIEGTNSGDVVLVEPGTYRVRILLYNSNVILKAADSTNKPVFDYTGQSIETWPGTLNNWHSRYGIEIQADDVLIENINVKGAKSNTTSAAAVMNSPLGFVQEPAGIGSQTNNVILRGMEISDSDEGLGSVGNNFLIDNCEVHHNGKPGSSSPRHNIYVHGGTIRINNSNFHSATQGENVHSRAKLTLIENSIMGPVYSNFPLAMYTPKADQPKDGSSFTQRYIVKNSIIDCRRPDGLNTTKMIGAMNSNAYTGLTQIIELYDNQYLGANNDNAVIVSLIRGVGHIGMGLISSGNNWDAFNGSKFLYLVDGQNPNDGFYSINVSDYSDDSLPGTIPPYEPPSTATVSIRARWDQEITEGLEGWRLYAGSTQNSLVQVADIPYTEGQALTHDVSVTINTGEVFFALKAYGTGGRVTPYSTLTSILVPETSGFESIPTPTNLMIEMLP